MTSDPASVKVELQRRTRNGAGEWTYSGRVLILAEIGNEEASEVHQTEVDAAVTFDAVKGWVRERENHLADGLRGNWTYAKLFIVPGGAELGEMRHAATVRNNFGTLELRVE